MAAPVFRPMLSFLQIPIYNLAKFLVPILNHLTKMECTVKDSFQFAEEVCEEDPTVSMGGLDLDSLFTNIPLDLIKLLIFASKSSLKTLILLKTLQSQNLSSYNLWLQWSLILYLTVYFKNRLMV